jgi:hypothetical protein
MFIPMDVAEGASGASADAPGVGLEIVSVSVCQWKQKLKTKKSKRSGKKAIAECAINFKVFWYYRPPNMN